MPYSSQRSFFQRPIHGSTKPKKLHQKEINFDAKKISSSKESSFFMLDVMASLNGFKFLILIVAVAHCLPQAEASCIWDCDKDLKDISYRLDGMRNSNPDLSSLRNIEYDLFQARLNGANSADLFRMDSALEEMKRREAHNSIFNDLKSSDAMFGKKGSTFTEKAEERRDQQPEPGQCVLANGIFSCRTP